VNGTERLPGALREVLRPVPLMPFEIGFVPCGWARGDPLVIRTHPHQKSVWQDPCVDYGLGPCRLPAGLIACVTFQEHEEEKVKRWLRWWNATVDRVGKDY
jgi:hypothetical protein